MRVSRMSFGAIGCLLAAATLWGDEPSEAPDDEQSIRQTVERYVQAFNKQDAATLASLWSPDAVYTNRITGEQVTGREAIEEQFVATFKEAEGLKLEVSVGSIQFVSPNVAVENGVAKFLRPNEAPEEVEYTAVYVRREGNWLLDRVTDQETSLVPSNFEHLKELGWMIGRWVDEDEEVRIETECSWTRNKNFITRSFKVSSQDRVEMAGMQIIGWDPAAKRIRSWVFDSDGGFAEGTWTHKGDRWFIRQTGVLPDGSQSSSVHVIRRVDDDTITLQSVSRVVDGELQPNMDEVVVVRQKTAP